MYFQNTPKKMEEPFNKQDKILRDLLQESSLEKPSLDFSKAVMEKIQAKSPVTAYKPLISKRSWGWIALVFLIASVGLYFYPESNWIDLDRGFVVEKLSGTTTFFPNVEISKTTLYAVVFLALFFIQIPFLKRFLEKNYH